MRKQTIKDLHYGKSSNNFLRSFYPHHNQLSSSLEKLVKTGFILLVNIINSYIHLALNRETLQNLVLLIEGRSSPCFDYLFDCIKKIINIWTKPQFALLSNSTIPWYRVGILRSAYRGEWRAKKTSAVVRISGS